MGEKMIWMETMQTVHLEEIGGKVFLLLMKICLKISKVIVVDYTDVFLTCWFSFL